MRPSPERGKTMEDYVVVVCHRNPITDELIETSTFWQSLEDAKNAAFEYAEMSDVWHVKVCKSVLNIMGSGAK